MIPKLSIATRTLLIVTLTISCAMFFRSIFTQPLFADSYLHLAVGKHIISFQEIPSHFDISYKITNKSLEWISHSWLSDGIFYLLIMHSIAILTPIILVVLWSAAILLIWVRLRNYRVPASIHILVLIAIQFASQTYWRIHPYLFGLILYQITGIVVERAVRSDKQRYLLFLPLLSVLWANLYGGYIFIFIGTILLYTITVPLSARTKHGKWAFSMLAIMVATFASSLINPYGTGIYASGGAFVGIVNLKRAFVMLPNLLSLVNQSFLLENVSTIPYAVFALILLFQFSAIVFFIMKRRFDFFRTYTLLLPLLALYPLSYFFVRFIPFTLFGSAPLLAVTVLQFRHTIRSVPYAGFVLSCMLIPYFIYLFFVPFKTLGIRTPTEQVEIIKRYSLPSNVLTTAELTGYVKYHLPHKLNIDLLDEVFDESETLNVLLQSGFISREALKSTLDSKHIATVIASKENGNFSRSIQLNLSDEWALLYIDANGTLFVRRNKVSENFLKKNELRYLSLVSSLGVDAKRIPEGTAELEYMLKKYPRNNLYRGQLATLYRIQKRPEKALAVLYEIPISQWDYKLFTEMGRLQASMGNCLQAEQFFQGALSDRTETNFSQAVLDLAIVYAGCFGDTQKARHYFERYLSFTIPHTEKDRAKKIAADFGIHVE